MNRQVPFPFLLAALVSATLLHPAAQASPPQQALGSGKGVRPPMATGQLIVRLRSDFPACAHCLLAQGRGLSAATGTRILDQLRLRYGIDRLEPVFGGVHAAARRQAAQQRALRTPAAPPLPDLSQIYLVEVSPKTDLLALAAEFRRDPNVVSAEPNYLYHADGFPSAQYLPPRSVGEVHGEGSDGTRLPDDPFLSSSGSWGQPFADLWGLLQIEAPAAWELSQGEGVVVAVVDTGVDLGHPDLAANAWHNTGEMPGNGIDDDGNGFVDDVDGWDFTSCARRDGGGDCVASKTRGPDVHDPVGHGTHVAGILAAVGDNGIGIIGVAPQTQVMAVKGLDQSSRGSNCDLAEAVVYAADQGAVIINASWSGPPSDTIKMAVEYATAKGAQVVAAAGNDAAPLERGVYPANLPEVIAVGATTHTDDPAGSSNFGGPLDLVAPGGGDSEPALDPDPQRSVLSLLARDSTLGRECRFECRSPAPGQDCDLHQVEVCEPSRFIVGEDYVRTSGTSFAAPHVSGVAALVRGEHPEFGPAQIRQALLQSADDLGPVGWDPSFGYGRVNARRAVEVAGSPFVELLTPDNGGKVREEQFPFVVRGSVLAPGSSVREWRLTVRREGRRHAREVAHGTEAASDAVLATLSLGGSTRIVPGRRYVLELEAVDARGNSVVDRKTFLVPAPRFAAIPIPDRYYEGSEDGSMSGDGKRIALTRPDRNGGTPGVWLYDVASRTLERIATGYNAQLTADGRTLVYAGNLPDGSSCPFFVDAIFYDVETGGTSCAPLGVSTGPLDAHGDRLAFVSNAPSLDPSVGNPDGSDETFLFDVAENHIRQVTSGPRRDQAEIQQLVMSADGQRLAFFSATQFDPTASTGETEQVFLYDDPTKTLRQLTGRAGAADAPAPFHLSLNADGSTLAYETDLGAALVRVASGDTKIVAEKGPAPYTFTMSPLLSAEGNRLGFVSAADLDPSVSNEDLIPEVFVMDLGNGVVRQVTDFVSPVQIGPSLLAMDAAANAFVIDGALVPVIDVATFAARVVQRRRPNRPPQLEVAETVSAPEGQPTTLQMKASDPDGDILTLYVQLPFADPQRRSEFGTTVFTDRGNGTGTLEVIPGYNQAGEYTLRIAAFDEAGGVARQDVRLVVLDAMIEGDANCDGQIDAADNAALVGSLFGDGSCPTADANGDGLVQVNDLTALLLKLAR